MEAMQSEDETHNPSRLPVRLAMTCRMRKNSFASSSVSLTFFMFSIAREWFFIDSHWNQEQPESSLPQTIEHPHS